MREVGRPLVPSSFHVSVHVGLHARTYFPVAPLPNEAVLLFHVRVLHSSIHAKVAIFDEPVFSCLVVLLHDSGTLDTVVLSLIHNAVLLPLSHNAQDFTFHLFVSLVLFIGLNKADYIIGVALVNSGHTTVLLVVPGVLWTVLGHHILSEPGGGPVERVVHGLRELGKGVDGPVVPHVVLHS